MHVERRTSRWWAGVRLIAYLTAIVIIVGGVVVALAIMLVMAIGMFFALGLVTVVIGLVGFALYMLWIHAARDRKPPR